MFGWLNKKIKLEKETYYEQIQNYKFPKTRDFIIVSCSILYIENIVNQCFEEILIEVGFKYDKILTEFKRYSITDNYGNHQEYDVRIWTTIFGENIYWTEKMFHSFYKKMDYEKFKENVLDSIRYYRENPEDSGL